MANALVQEVSYPPAAELPSRVVVVVERDARAGELLGRYLASRGWSVVREADPRNVIRRWRTPHDGTPLVFMNVPPDDPGPFELLGALAAHALAARVIACVPDWIDGLGSLGIERVLAAPCRFSEIAEALEEVRRGFVVRREP